MSLIVFVLIAASLWRYSHLGSAQPDSTALEIQSDIGERAASVGGKDPIESLETIPGMKTGLNDVEPPSDGTWGELVRFRYEMRGCDTETVGVNVQIACERIVVADHPYGLLSDAQLRKMANIDGEAALVLGARLGYRGSGVAEYRESLELLTAAVALTGHADALNMLMTQYGITSAASFKNGELDVGRTSASYVWHKTGYDLGLFTKADLDRFAKPLRANGGIDFSALDASAAQRTNWFKARRLELTGGTFS